MVQAKISARAGVPLADVFIDAGHPLANRTLDGFLKIGAIGACHAASLEGSNMLRRESVSKRDIENMVKKMGRDAMQWGVVAGVYAGVGYGMEQVRGKHDWKTACLGGALTGALLALAEPRFSKDKMVRHAVTGGAIATASEFLRYLT